MRGLTACDQWGDTARTQLAAVELLVVAAVRDQATRPPFRRAGAAVHRWDRLEQQQQLRAVVSVRAGERPGERDAARVGQQVVLRAATAPVDRARAGRGAPFLAWM